MPSHVAASGTVKDSGSSASEWCERWASCRHRLRLRSYDLVCWTRASGGSARNRSKAPQFGRRIDAAGFNALQHPWAHARSTRETSSVGLCSVCSYRRSRIRNPPHPNGCLSQVSRGRWVSVGARDDCLQVKNRAPHLPAPRRPLSALQAPADPRSASADRRSLQRRRSGYA